LRIRDPRKNATLSLMDLESRRYTRAKGDYSAPPIPVARWWVIEGVDRERLASPILLIQAGSEDRHAERDWPGHQVL
jgi:hypothetical protein